MTNTTLLQIFILQSIAKEKSYPYEIFKLLKNKGVEIKLHSTYNCLKALEKKGKHLEENRKQLPKEKYFSNNQLKQMRERKGENK